MWIGDVLADRFSIERPLGGGGMGSVYLAADRVSGTRVAIKVMDREGDALSQRFSQEVRLVAELSHPAIVRYVAHGTTADREPYLAMEWLDGEDLQQRLRREGLTIAETLALARRVSEGLAAAHERRVVHRDIKPSNVFLVGGDPTRAKILDFGIARATIGGPPITSSGLVVGTIGFMSPEQASGSPDVDARTDVFALGCVLFQCLTGAAPFVGEHAVAVLAKVLRDEAPRVSTRRSGVSAALDDLVARMLAKDPAHRPSNGAALLGELDRLAASGDTSTATGGAPLRVSDVEQRIVSIVLIEPARPTAAPATTEIRRAPPGAPDAGDDTLVLRPIVESQGGELVHLANGAFLASFAARGGIVDQAERVATCALSLRASAPRARLSLATGRTSTAMGSPMGPLIDRAAHLLRVGDETESATGAGVLVDDSTAALLGSRFEFTALGEGRLLVTGVAKDDPTGERRLLNKATPFVGRDKEMALLDATLTQCVEEHVARAVLVTGVAGIGKSRLRSEFVRRAEARFGTSVLLAQGDPVAAGSALVVCRRLLRRAIDAGGLRDGSPAARISELVHRRFTGEDAHRIADFLGELLGVPGEGEPSPQLRAARNDPRLMAEWLKRSFIDWLVAEAKSRPVLVVLEDLHWGDLPSVTFLGELLYENGEIPLFVLALARPEVHDVFPRLWPSGIRQEIELGGITRRAAERFARSVLGEGADAAAIERVVRLSDGNAFYLEELIRRVAERPDDALPDSILAMVESRLARLDPESRRALRAASVFGEVFWESAVLTLLGQSAHPSDLHGLLGGLVQAEFLENRKSSRFAGEPEYGFRHGLLREAAYAMLPASDRTTAHRLAGEWLESHSENDALLVADHFERSDRTTRAVPWLVRAAHSAYEGNNLDAVITLSERGIQIGASGAELGLLRSLEAYAGLWSGAWPAVYERSIESLRALPPGGAEWFRAAAAAVVSSSCLGNPGGAMEVLGAISTFAGTLAPSGPYAFSVFMLVIGCYEFAQADMARALIARLEDTRAAYDVRDLAFDGWYELAIAYHLMRSDDTGHALTRVRRAARAFETIGDTTSRTFTVHAEAIVRMELEQSELAARAACAMVENKEGLGAVAAWGGMFSAWANVQLGRYAEGIEIARGLLDGPDHLLAENSRCAIAEAELELGLPSVETTAQAILDGPFIPDTHANALCVLARLELRRGNFARAEEYAARGLDVQKSGIAPRATSILLAVRAEALLRSNRVDEGKAVLRVARDRVLRVAGTLADEAEREAYQHAFGAHAKTLALAREWLD